MGHRDTVADMSRLRLPVAWEEAAPAAAAQVPPGVDGAPARPLWKRFGWLGALALAGAGAAGWQFAGGGEPPARFTTAVAEIATIEDIVSATGTVQPLEYVDVGTQVTGQLRTLRVASATW
jgi:macrolide-specific efflux system membrane fusion protein